MYLKQLSLVNFRNYTNFQLEFSTRPSVIIAPNGVGKTNILEAIYVLATGMSFRDGKVDSMIHIDREVGHLMGLVENAHTTELQVTLTRGFVQGKRVAKRRLLVNGVGRTKSKFIGILSAVIFRPEDMRLVEGSPSRRRGFFDEVLIQADPAYARSVTTYKQALVRRNKLLEMIRENQTSRTVLAYWDQLVLKHGSYIQSKRRQLVDFFNTSSDYTDFEIEMEYDVSVMSEARLEQYKLQEVAAGHTLVGPHRDDLILKSVLKHSQNLQKVDLSVFGSRGQQRLGVVWLKLHALEYLDSILKHRPLLLLDDILSELDQNHRELIIQLMDQQQTIITSADEHVIEDIPGDRINLLSIQK